MMRFQSKLIKAWVLIFVASLALGACAQGAAPSPNTSQDLPVLKMTLLPILDALPMYVAQEQGLFEKHGVKVEFIPAASAAERDQIITSGQADGMINEVVSTILYNKDKTQVQIVRFARAAGADSPMFRILVSAKSNIQSVQDLKGVPVGISEATVIEYLTDRMLAAEGLQPEEIEKIAIPKIPDRMALLNSGELQAAMLPDPLSTLAMNSGARLILDDTKYPELSYSTIAFRKPVLDEKPEAVRAFLSALEEAVQMIDTEPAKWNKILGEQKLIPEALAANFVVPQFVTAGVPSLSQWNDVLEWAKTRGLTTQDVSYSDSVTDAFLPK